jgi:hypothetical protein
MCGSGTRDIAKAVYLATSNAAAHHWDYFLQFEIPRSHGGKSSSRYQMRRLLYGHLQAVGGASLFILCRELPVSIFTMLTSLGEFATIASVFRWFRGFVVFSASLTSAKSSLPSIVLSMEVSYQPRAACIAFGLLSRL